VLPSYREGLPGALMEAAACGRALIATDALGCREIAIDGKTGLLVPVANSDALAQVMIRLAESSELRARFAKAARELVVEKLSATILGKSIVELYNEQTQKASITGDVCKPQHGRHRAPA
jgi:glycosyltransferase involved in cell wall biosynthesis